MPLGHQYHAKVVKKSYLPMLQAAHVKMQYHSGTNFMPRLSEPLFHAANFAPADFAPVEAAPLGNQLHGAVHLNYLSTLQIAHLWKQRHSGTNFMQQLLAANLKPLEVVTVFCGYKHAYQAPGPRCPGDLRQTLVVVMFR